MSRRARLKKFRKELADSLRRQNVSPLSQTHEEAVIAWLTGGNLPIEHCFLANNSFCIWSAERGELLLMKVCDGDPVWHEACREFLRQRNAAFASVDAVNTEVLRRGLPGAVSDETSTSASKQCQ